MAPLLGKDDDAKGTAAENPHILVARAEALRQLGPEVCSLGIVIAVQFFAWKTCPERHLVGPCLWCCLVKEPAIAGANSDAEGLEQGHAAVVSGTHAHSTWH